MEKPRPGLGAERLTVRGTYAAICGLHGVRTDVGYEIHRDGETAALDGVQWADWGMEGRLLAVTEDGRLQILEGDRVAWQADEGSNEPDPSPPPEEAWAW